MFINGAPAMVIDHLLIIADLHLGITNDIREKGIMLPSQVTNLANRLNELKEKTKTTKLVMLGDIKHNIPNISWQEYREIPEFFSKLNFKDIIVLKGNHDGNIEKLLPKHVKIRKSYSYTRYVFTHGHIKIKTSKKIIVIGHNQPHIRFRDEIGASYIEPIWVKGPLTGFYKNKKLIMVPAFNELAGATLVNKDRLLGPIANCLDRNKARCFLLDGTDLGVLNDLAVKD